MRKNEETKGHSHSTARKPGWRHLISVSSLPQLVEILTFGLNYCSFLQMFRVNQTQLLVSEVLCYWVHFSFSFKTTAASTKQISLVSREGISKSGCGEWEGLIWWSGGKESTCKKNLQLQHSCWSRYLYIFLKNFKECNGPEEQKDIKCRSRSHLSEQSRSPQGILFSAANLPAGICLWLIGFLSNNLWETFSCLLGHKAKEVWILLCFFRIWSFNYYIYYSQTIIIFLEMVFFFKCGAIWQKILCHINWPSFKYATKPL